MGQFSESRGWLDKKEGVVFLRGGWVNNPMLTVDANFFCFRPEIPFLGKFVPKTQSC